MANNFVDHQQERIILYHLYSSRSLLDVFEFDLDPEDFDRVEHQEIYSKFYESACEDTKKGKFNDITNKLTAKSAEYYINNLTADFITGDPYYAVQVVKEFSMSRKLHRKLKEFESMLTEKPVLDVADAMSNFTLELTINRNKEYISSNADIVGQTLRVIEESRQGKPQRGVKTGISAIDDRIGFFGNGQMIVIGAPSSHGKTSLGLSMAYNQAKSGVSIGYISFEMGADELGMRLASMRTMDLHGEKGYVSADKVARRMVFRPTDYDVIEAAASDFLNFPFHIVNKRRMNINEVISTAKRLKTLFGIEVLYIDYLQQVQGERGQKYYSRESEVSFISTAVRELAENMDIPIVVMAQLNRDIDKRKTYPVPSDLRESATIEHDADKLLLFWRPKRSGVEEINNLRIEQSYVQLNIAKNRGGEGGLMDLYMHMPTTYIMDAHNEIKADEQIPF